MSWRRGLRADCTRGVLDQRRADKEKNPKRQEKFGRLHGILRKLQLLIECGLKVRLIYRWGIYVKRNIFYEDAGNFPEPAQAGVVTDASRKNFADSSGGVGLI